MKLRVLNSDETDKILIDLDRYWELCTLITAEARSRFNEALKNETNEYKWSIFSPFTFCIKTIEEMIYKVCGGEFRSTESTFLTEHGFIEFLSSSYFYRNSSDCYFTEQKYNDLISFASELNDLNIYRLADFHYLLQNYAVKPFDLDAADLVYLRDFSTTLSYLEIMWRDYNNAL